MQELGPAFVAGCRLGGGSSTTECCCCNALSTASAACAAVSLSFSGALLLNMSISVFRRHLLRRGQSCLLAIERELTQSLLLPRREDPQVRTPFLRIGLRKTELPQRGRRRLSAILCTEHPPRFTHPQRCVQLCFVKKNWDNCGAARRELSKNSSSVVFRSQ